MATSTFAAPPVRVDWFDAETRTGWHDISKAKRYELPLITTTGFLVHQTEDLLVVGQGISGKQILNLTIIPAKWVKRIVKLRGL